MPVRYTTQTIVNFDKYNTYSRIVDPDSEAMVNAKGETRRLEVEEALAPMA